MSLATARCYLLQDNSDLAVLPGLRPGFRSQFCSLFDSYWPNIYLGHSLFYA